MRERKRDKKGEVRDGEKEKSKSEGKVCDKEERLKDNRKKEVKK